MIKNTWVYVNNTSDTSYSTPVPLGTVLPSNAFPDAEWEIRELLAIYNEILTTEGHDSNSGSSNLFQLSPEVIYRKIKSITQISEQHRAARVMMISGV